MTRDYVAQTEQPARFNRAPEAYAVVDEVLNDIFDRPLEPEVDSQPAVRLDEKIDDLAMHLACEHGETDEEGTGYTFSMEQFDDFINAFVPALAQQESYKVPEGYRLQPISEYDAMCAALAQCDGQACVHCEPEHGCKPHGQQREAAKANGTIEHIEALEADGARLRGIISVYEAAANGAEGVWFYQGDGHDFPASLTCPVVMRAPQFRELVKAAATEQAIQKAAATLPEGYVIHLYVEKDSAYIDLTDADDDPVHIDTEDRDLAEQMAEATERARIDSAPDARQH